MSVSTFTIALLLSSTTAATENTAPQEMPAQADAAEDQNTPDSGHAATTAPATTTAPEPLPFTLPVLPLQPAPPLQDAKTAPSDSSDEAIVVTGGRRITRADPLAGVNAASYAVINVVDKAVVGPTAKTYERVVPKPIRNGLRNFLINLAEPIVFVNFLLQFKPGKAAETAGRFALNSTIGVAGLFDMAKRKPFHLPYRQNGFANTLGYHGVKTGPFLFVPILGPTTVRDLAGRILDLSLMPATLGKPFSRPIYGLTTGIVKSMNDRVEFDDEMKKIRASSDPYVASRDLYLKRRQAEIDALRGRRTEPTLPPVPVGDAATPAPSSSIAPAPEGPSPTPQPIPLPPLSPAPAQ